MTKILEAEIHFEQLRSSFRGFRKMETQQRAMKTTAILPVMEPFSPNTINIS